MKDFIVLVSVFFISSLIVMATWNAAMPQLFHLPEINYGMAMILRFLTSNLFSHETVLPKN